MAWGVPVEVVNRVHQDGRAGAHPGVLAQQLQVRSANRAAGVEEVSLELCREAVEVDTTCGAAQ